MGGKTTYIFLISQFCLWLFLLPLQAQDTDVLDKKIELTKKKGTIYSSLSEVSDRSGYLFIYDSKLINNEQKIQIKSGKYTIREAVRLIIDNPEIDMRIVGKHILLYKPEVKETIVLEPTSDNNSEIKLKVDSFFTIEGIIRDQYTEEILSFAAIGILEHSIGTVSNQSGEFRFRLPDSLRHSQLHISHLGYETQEIACAALVNNYNQIVMVPKVIPIQEVIVRITNPYRLLEDMLDHRGNNYANTPVYHTAFYREGIEYKKRLASLTESVIKIYKTPSKSGTDQVKLLKMRNITNKNETDTLITKFKSGINACLMLDVVKNLPDFLNLQSEHPYIYVHSDITTIDNRLANVVSFEQPRYNEDNLYKGELYIDMENQALVAARFEINPAHIENTTEMYVAKKSKNIRVTPQKIAYSVSYKQWNGRYYVNHIRGDLYFRVKKKGSLFSNAPVHIWFEMVNCATDTINVNRFARNEVLSTRTILGDTKYVYDESFWDNFNIIPPEEQLTNAINKIAAKIEETGY